jgi:hypothetical protein
MDSSFTSANVIQEVCRYMLSDMLGHLRVDFILIQKLAMYFAVCVFFTRKYVIIMLFMSQKAVN